MLSSITLKRPGNKDEECKLLESIAELVQGDTYLAELFTAEMVNDMQGRMRNDFHCNLYADYRENAAMCDHLEDEKRDLQRVADETKQFADGAIQKKNEIIQQMQETIDRLSNRFNESNDKGLEMLADMNQLQSALSDREMEICQLKAKLYDLTCTK